MEGQGAPRTRALWFWVGVLSTVLAVQGINTVAQAQGAGQTADQNALAQPRLQLHGAPGVPLPQPLAPSDAALIRRIFGLQAAGSAADASNETAHLANQLILGTILADRYLRPVYRPSVPELTDWLARFGDQPEAPAIRSLLARLSPETANSDGDSQPDPSPQYRGRRTPRDLPIRALFVQNRDAAALASAEPLLSAPGDATTATPRFTAGLAAWRLGQTDGAWLFFTSAYHAASTSDLRAASAYWAARAGQRRRNREAFASWMRRAALETRTFYGEVARRALSPTIPCLPGGTIGDADIDALLATPQGRRAFALLQVGERRYAEAELRGLWTDTAEEGLLDRPIALIAGAVGFTQLLNEIEQSPPTRRRPNSITFERLQPEGGFLVDPPLVYALVRQESNFRSVAVSVSGARGLMQIMPATAQAVAGDKANRLEDPAVNLAIGQRYLLVLAADDAIDGDLIRLLASYGQGQGGLRKWVGTVRDDGDPLMFIEAIPNPATRAFVQDELLHSWAYAEMLHQPATSLDDLAAGRYPRLLRAEPASHPNQSGRTGACVASER